MVDSCGLDFDIVVENGNEKTLRTVNVYDVGISIKFWGGNQLMLDTEYREHPGCSWILWIVGESLPNPNWCAERS